MFAVLQKFLAGMNGRWSSLGTPMRLLIVVFAVLVFSLAAPWLNELFFYVLARSYVDDIADVFDLNKHLAKAITLVVGVTAAYLAWKTFSLSAGRRKIGYFGILGLLIGYSLLLWYGTKGHFFDPKGNSIKCYVLTHAGEVRYGEHPGIDPTTGRPCRPVTPELIDLLEEYRKGRRPQRITSSSPTFFDPRSSEPSVWYFTDRDGAIEIFDLMGFHPETGEELQPVTRDIVDVWKAQNAPPERIGDPERFAFFDAITGKPRVWYWRGPTGEYEFYNHPGFHPRTGEPLAMITKDAFDAWRRELDAEKKADNDRKDREERDRQAVSKQQRERAEEEERKRKAADEREQKRVEQEARESQAAQENEQRKQAEEQQSASGCDQLAANPTDPRRPTDVPGVRYDDVKLQAKKAVEACALAMKTYPAEQRFRYQYARALQVDEPQKAIKLHKQLVHDGYLASYDNAGWILINTYKNIPEAVQLFKEGARRGDPDSMFSLADMIDRHYFAPETDPTATRYALLSRAAQLGHPGAQFALEQERIKNQQLQIQQQNQQQQEQLMI